MPAQRGLAGTAPLPGPTWAAMDHERLLRGAPASPGLAHGAAVRLDPPAAEPDAIVSEERRGAERDRALAALEAAAAELDALAERLAARGRATEADIVATGAPMARDPTLAA